ncbi:hypothetical protein R3P38DRAFT_1100480 [Favolaschia claudopus]|uniref:Uncharacterized protein n=1 Tax=Favolaschia claudopus TaxID=2862362 RepID=A0AAW0BB43_9AGAR
MPYIYHHLALPSVVCMYPSPRVSDVCRRSIHLGLSSIHSLLFSFLCFYHFIAYYSPQFLHTPLWTAGRTESWPATPLPSVSPPSPTISYLALSPRCLFYLECMPSCTLVLPAVGCLPIADPNSRHRHRRSMIQGIKGPCIIHSGGTIDIGLDATCIL